MGLINKKYLGTLTAILVLFSAQARAEQNVVESNAGANDYNSSEKTIANFYQLTNDIYVGGRPATRDIATLQSQHGIKTIINLEDSPQTVQQERQAATRVGMQVISSPMNARQRPSDSQVDDILRAMQESRNLPIFLHCFHGEDRSGLITGLYHVLVEKWDPAKAYQEMLNHGYHPSFKELDNYFRDRTGYHGK